MLKRKLPLLLASLLLVAFAESALAEETLPELIRRVKPSVVSVITYNEKGEALITGSGFFVRPGRVVTNLHVVEGAARVEVRTFEGKGRTYRVEGVASIDEEGDLAVLSVDAAAERSRALDLARTIPEEGEKIFVIGNPLRLEGSVADGIVSAVREVPNLGKIIQITAPISHGNSGSPVFNMKGEVVGVVTIKVTNGQNINLALGASRVSDLKPAEKLLDFGDLQPRSRTAGAAAQQPEALAEWWYKNGLNSLWLGNYDSALGYFQNAVDKNPNRAEAWIQVGYCKVKQGKNGDAIRAFQRALRLRPNSVEAYNKLGDAYYYDNNFYRAAEAYQQAVNLRPDLPEGYYNLGLAYLELGNREAAFAQARTLKALDAGLHARLMRELER
ncbi:MAG TPA: trypsin-like peptidase domain-containing protein [Pyrinomonadaceae bacterium]|nr:trypsin-like peptidase domain-containing protein [Pyrinomonadaceae bacterium]